MKKILAITVILPILFCAACSKEESTKVYNSPEGEVEVTHKQIDEKSHEMTVKSKEGAATMKSGAASIPKDLGVPIYPDVEQEEGGTWSMSGMGNEEGEFSSTVLISKDPIDKVAAFYREKLEGSDPNIFEMAMPNGKMVNITVEKDDVTSSVVLVENKEKGGTNIQITKAAK